MKKAMRSAIAALTATLLAGAAAAAAYSVDRRKESTFTTIFVVARENTAAAETLQYRTVGLGAFPGQNFIEASGNLHFAAGESSKSVTVTTRIANNMAYKFTDGAFHRRIYGFEVTDMGGFTLAERSDDVPNTRVERSKAYSEHTP